MFFEIRFYQGLSFTDGEDRLNVDLGKGVRHAKHKHFAPSGAKAVSLSAHRGGRAANRLIADMSMEKYCSHDLGSWLHLGSSASGPSLIQRSKTTIQRL